MKNILSKITVFLTFFLIFACTKTTDEKDPIVKKKRINPNVKERTAEARDQGFTIFGGKQKDAFAANNVMWRATVEVLSFAPIGQLSYSGGVYSTDWYSSSNSSGKESVKINVTFLSKEVASTSIKVSGFKRVCKNSNNENCSISKTKNNFNSKIKDAILKKVTEIRIEEQNKKN